MSLLAFDTTHGFCSVAIANGSNVIISKRIEETSRQAELLVPTIEEALNDAGYGYEDIKTIATTVGPGSFTGVRIGLAAAHGLLLATHASFFGISALKALAWMATELEQVITSKQLHTVLDARRGQVFLQTFEWKTLKSTTEAQLCDYETAASIIGNEPATLVGNGASLIKPYLCEHVKIQEKIQLPDADAVAMLTYFSLRQQQEGLPPSPLYIRKPDAKLPSKKAL